MGTTTLILIGLAVLPLTPATLQRLRSIRRDSLFKLDKKSAYVAMAYDYYKEGTGEVKGNGNLLNTNSSAATHLLTNSGCSTTALTRVHTTKTDTYALALRRITTEQNSSTRIVLLTMSQIKRK